VKARAELAALIERVRLATNGLAELIGPAGAVGPDLVEAIRTTREEVERRLAGEEIAVALAGDPAAKRALLNAIVGARAFDPKARLAASAVVTLRGARTFDYAAQMRDGTSVEFGWRMPAREDSFAKAQQRAATEREAAEAAERELREHLEAQREGDDDTVTLPASDVVFRPPSMIARFWRRVRRALRSALSLFRDAPRLPAAAANDDAARDEVADTLAALERSLAEARARLQQATARVEALRTERPKYDQERAEAFVQDVRSLTDESARGKGVVSLSVACPTVQLPRGVALLDASEPPSTADAIVFVPAANGNGEGERIPAPAESQRAPRVHVVRKHADLAGALERIRAEQSYFAAVRAAAAVQACIGRVGDEAVKAEANCERRIAALESQRIPDPAEFRATQMVRVSRAIDDGARDVQEATLQRLRGDMARAKEAWHTELNACSTREQMEAFVGTINRTARDQMQTLVDDIGHHAVLELQRVSESIQTWLLEEIRGRYHLARRIEEGAPAAVVGEAMEVPIQRSPLASALDKFESRRVNLGLGGVAAGAVLGTLIVPGVGTAVGAIVGVLAGLLRGLDSLKKECVGRLDACLDEVEQKIAGHITGRHGSFVEELRASLDDALDIALEQLDASISRLMALERRTLETERRKRADLAKLRALLEENVIRVATPPEARPVSPVVTSRARQ
jgi:hypothetical protein